MKWQLYEANDMNPRIALAALVALSAIALGTTTAEARRPQTGSHFQTEPNNDGRVSFVRGGTIRPYAGQRRTASRSVGAHNRPRTSARARPAPVRAALAAPSYSRERLIWASFVPEATPDEIKASVDRGPEPYRVDQVGPIRVSSVYGPIKVAAPYADRFLGLFADMKRMGIKVWLITCLAEGHKGGSNHGWAGACDIGQTAWGRTPVTELLGHKLSWLIRKHGLFDGCDYTDCGHVEAKKGLHNSPVPNDRAYVRARRDYLGFREMVRQ